MAKLYAEITSDKGGRVVGKGGNESLHVNITRNGKMLGTLKIRSTDYTYDIYFSGSYIQGGEDYDGSWPKK